MILALYVIGSAFGLVLLSARLREAHQELARLRDEGDDRAQAVRDEYAAYAHGVAVSRACLLAGLAMASWSAPRPAARPAGSGRAGSREDAPDGRAGR